MADCTLHMHGQLCMNFGTTDCVGLRREKLCLITANSMRYLDGPLSSHQTLPMSHDIEPVLTSTQEEGT
jgi:hypothetical protein